MHAQMQLSSLAGQPLHKEEGSGTVPLLELFCWNAINIREFVFSYARFTLCGDTLTAAHGLHVKRSALVCQVSTVQLWFMLAYRDHAAAARFAYSCSP